MKRSIESNVEVPSQLRIAIISKKNLVIYSYFQGTFIVFNMILMWRYFYTLCVSATRMYLLKDQYKKLIFHYLMSG